MNKIKVEQKDLIIQDEKKIIEMLSNNFVLRVKGNSVCGIKGLGKNVQITIYLEENSTLKLDLFLKMKDTKTKIVIYNSANATLDLNYACTYMGENELIIDSQLNCSNAQNTICIRSVENNGSLSIKAMGTIYEFTNDNVYLEDIKTLTNNNNSIKIMPDLLVKTNSVIANHNATISHIDNRELFYLQSKGLNKETAISLIKKGFLKEIISIEELKVEEVNVNV